MTYDLKFEQTIKERKDEGIILTEKEIQTLRLRYETTRFICNMNPTHMVTLTYRRNPSEELIRKTTKGFCMRANEEIFGSNGSKAVNMIIVVERRTSDREHLHIAIKDPTDAMSAGMIAKNKKTYGEDFLPSVLNKAWKDAGKQYENITGTPDSIGTRDQWFRPIDDVKDCADYMTKEISLGNTELIDLENTVTNGKRVKGSSGCR